MTSVVHPDVPYSGLLENHLPHLPILGAFDRATVRGGEHEVVVLPAVPRLEAFRGLDLAVCLEERQEFGWALEGELALALALPEDDASARAFWAPIGVARAVLETDLLVAGVPLLLAVRLTAGVVSVIPALLLAGPAVPLLAALVRV
ncbi:hypothetical protein GCM10023075_77070 [Streptosporangium album]